MSHSWLPVVPNPGQVCNKAKAKAEDTAFLHDVLSRLPSLLSPPSLISLRPLLSQAVLWDTEEV